MRYPAILLLLLVLPGLLLPAGFALRICRCASAAVENGGAGAASCCATGKHGEQRGAGGCHAPGCCKARQPDRGAPPTIDAPCGCVWLTAPSDRPEPLLPDKAAAAEVACLPPSTSTSIPPPADLGYEHRWCAADIRPPPPDRQRTLPLLL